MKENMVGLRLNVDCKRITIFCNLAVVHNKLRIVIPHSTSKISSIPCYLNCCLKNNNNTNNNIISYYIIINIKDTVVSEM